MKKGSMLLAAFVLFWPLLGKAEEEGYYSESFARLSFVKGDVSVERANELGTEEGVVNLALVEGDKLITREGRAEVHFGRKNYLRLDTGSEVEFSAMPREGDDRVRLHLLAGSVYLRISYLREEKTFEIHTPDASFYVLEEGLYRLDMRKANVTLLSVVEGSIEAAGETGSQLVGSRESLIASNGQLGAQMGLSPRRDDFDYWNKDRDSLVRQYASRRYLPAELDDYEGELESHGYWVYERPYGYVWVPYVVYADWRPYYYGRWVWYPICGWTWVSHEPWGWCVYHYGRWHWRLGLGWYWIPTRYWGPAWVHWYWDYDYIGWCPLSWYNRPVVIVNNYFYDRYHHSYYPAHSRALTVVQKSQLQAPDVSRVALRQVEASRLGQITLQARQPEIKPTVSRVSLASTSGVKSLPTPQVRPAGKTLGSSGRQISSGAPSGLSADREKLSPGSDRSESVTKRTTERLSLRRGVTGYSPARKESTPARPSLGSSSAAPRKIKSDSAATERSPVSSSLGRVKSYSSAMSVSSPAYPSRSRLTSFQRETPRYFAPDSTLPRLKPSSPDSLSSGPSRGESRSFPSSFERENNSPRSPSVSLPKSIFSAPRSFSSPPTISTPRNPVRSSPSFSSSSPSRSFAPRSSGSAPSSSRPSSGRVVKKND